MHYPKVQSASAKEDHILLITFDNGDQRKYDVKPLLEHEVFAPLKNLSFFKTVKVETGGYAVVWNEAIDISEYELWRHGTPYSSVTAD